MTFKRDLYERLLQWKNGSERIPMIIRGLRQTGKTTLALSFANEQYENAFYIDFRKQASAHAIFEGDFNIDDVIFSISSLPREKRLKTGSAMVPGKTLLIFDEIQDCPNARSCLKYFMLDGRFDVLCSGSMLGVKGYRRSKKPNRGTGVGAEDYVELYPLNFAEFLLAIGVNDSVVSSLRSYLEKRRALPAVLHAQLSEYFLQYMLVGGMPEAVAKFVETKDYGQTRRVLRRILSDYESDFGTHLNDDLNVTVDDVERALIHEVFRSIPRQLAKENKKFQFSVVKPRGDVRTYGFALQYLEDYGLIVRARNLSTLQEPLDYFANEDQFKVYLCDTGLFIAMLGDDVPVAIVSGSLGTGKGMIYENIMADAYAKQGRPLFYYRKDSGLEIDFVDAFKGIVTLIEVKAKSGATKASASVLSDTRNQANRLIRIGASNVGWALPILTIPHYLTHLVGNGFFWASVE